MCSLCHFHKARLLKTLHESLCLQLNRQLRSHYSQLHLYTAGWILLCFGFPQRTQNSSYHSRVFSVTVILPNMFFFSTKYWQMFIINQFLMQWNISRMVMCSGCVWSQRSRCVCQWSAVWDSLHGLDQQWMSSSCHVCEACLWSMISSSTARPALHTTDSNDFDVLLQVSISVWKMCAR